MKVSFSAPEQDGEDGVGAEGQMENTEPSHHCQAPCYPWMWRSWGNSLGPWLHRIYCKFCIGACTIGSLVHAPMNLAKHLKEKIGTMGGNNKGSLLDWRSSCGCTISAEPAKWMMIKEHPRPGQSMNKGLWHIQLFRDLTPWTSFEFLWNTWVLFLRNCPLEVPRSNGKTVAWESRGLLHQPCVWTSLSRRRGPGHCVCLCFHLLSVKWRCQLIGPSPFQF